MWLVWWVSVWLIATEPNRNSAILAIHIFLNTAHASVSTEPPTTTMLNRGPNRGEHWELGVWDSLSRPVGTVSTTPPAPGTE